MFDEKNEFDELATVLHKYQKNTDYLVVVILWMGIVIFVSGEFHRLGFLVIWILALCSNVVLGVIASSAILISITSGVMNRYGLHVEDFYEYRWIAMFWLILSCFFILLYHFRGIRKEEYTKLYLRKNRFCICAIILFFDIYAMGHEIIIEFVSRVKNPLVQNWHHWILSWNPMMVGVCGILVVNAWMVQEWLVAFIEENFRN